MSVVVASGPQKPTSSFLLSAEARRVSFQMVATTSAHRKFSGSLDYNLVTELDFNSIVCL